MGYSHNFYVIDISKIKEIEGSQNLNLVGDILRDREDNVTQVNEKFEDQIEFDEIPSCSDAIRQIFDGTYPFDVDSPIFAFSLQIICEHFGVAAPTETAISNVAQHPYEEQLSDSSLPVLLPECSDPPEVSFLEAAQIEDEIAALQKYLDADPKPVNKWSKLSEEEMEAEVRAYLEVLTKAKNEDLGIISFRY